MGAGGCALILMNCVSRRWLGLPHLRDLGLVFSSEPGDGLRLQWCREPPRVAFCNLGQFPEDLILPSF